MKKSINICILFFLAIGCDSDDDGSAAQQPCYYAMSNTCASVNPIEINNTTYSIRATASYPSAYTGQTVRGDCQTPNAASLPTEKLDYFICSAEDGNRGSATIVDDVEELECSLKGGKFLLTTSQLEMKAFSGDVEVALKCNGFAPSLRDGF